jgi:phosphatidylethanolamine-binding protein (PEBP) family uncharacterized protein
MSFTKYFTVLTLWAAVFAVGCGSQTDVNSWKISSPVITDGGEIPLDYTCSSREFAVAMNNPEFNWTEGPAGTRSYALVAKHLAIAEDDPTRADYWKGFMWVIWDIPASMHQIPTNLGRDQFPAAIPGSQQWSIRNQFGFFAPCPNLNPAADPATRVTDRYGFTLYALDTAKLPLPPKEADISNYTYTLTKMLDQVAIGKIQLNAVSSAVSTAPPVPVDMKTLVFPAGTVPAP